MNPATLYTRALVVQQALELLECEARESDALASPDAVRDYLRLLLADRPHEVFAVVFLDAQNRVIVTLEMFRGTLTQTSVYPREVLIEARIVSRSWIRLGKSSRPTTIWISISSLMLALIHDQRRRLVLYCSGGAIWQP